MSDNSHFSFTRSSYDSCALSQKNRESTDPFDWATDASITESQQSCFQATSPFMHNPFHSVPSGSVDIESDLRGQSLNLSKCATHKFNPQNAKPIQYTFNECADDILVPEYTRINKPCNIFSGMSINRFHPLCDDMQELDKIPSNAVFGVNTRLQVKDAFKASRQNIAKTPLGMINTKIPCSVQGISCATITPQ